MGSLNILKVSQFILALLGLIFALTTRYQYVVYIIFWVASIVYMLIIIICLLTGKSFLSSTGQAVVEIFLGVILIAYTLHICITCPMDVMMILACCIGFLLPALFFITAYEKM